VRFKFPCRPFPCVQPFNPRVHSCPPVAPKSDEGGFVDKPLTLLPLFSPVHPAMAGPRSSASSAVKSSAPSGLCFPASLAF
jgi:hypothetical protein